MTDSQHISETPLPPLTWAVPQLRDLFELYWKVHKDGLPQFFPSAEEPYNGANTDFYRTNGYLPGPIPHQDKMLDNEIHPIFEKRNWITPFCAESYPSQGFDQYYTLILPALRLAFKFLEDPQMLKFWIHIRYGDPGYVNGWVGIKESPQEQDPEMIEKIKEELRNAAGKVTFTFLAEEDMEGFQGMCYPNLRWISRLYESCANKPADSRATWYNEWYNAQDKEIRPTIVLSVDEYWRAFARYPSPTKLRQNFNLAWIILHEFAHASIMLWQPEISGLEEPIIQPTDIFPEAGLSWEHFACGGDIWSTPSNGPMMCKEFDHQYPSFEPGTFPLRTPVPWSCITQWFLKDTWENITERLDRLQVPSIRLQTDVYQTTRRYNPH
jgi:hypothetical protein